MRETKKTWTFINLSNTEQKIVVLDEQSAATMRGNLTGEWLEEEVTTVRTLVGEGSHQDFVHQMTNSPTEVKQVSPAEQNSSQESSSSTENPQDPITQQGTISFNEAIQKKVETQSQTQFIRPIPNENQPLAQVEKSEKNPLVERRKHPRLKFEFRVVVISGAHSYRNTSTDISLGGIRLKKPLPLYFLDTQCTIFVSHPLLRENVQLSCRVLADPKDHSRIQFLDSDPKQHQRLADWLKEASEQIKKAS
ncbi:MAG: PilZ domain-containing protein [Bdellovibrionia bacterium]